MSASSDSDDDGAPLLLEYVFDMNPNTASVAGLPVVRIMANRLELSYTKVRSDIQHGVEASSDLRIWNSDGVDQGGAGPTVTASVPLSGSGTRRFLRLRVTLP